MGVLKECHTWALGLMWTWPRVIPGPSYWAPAGSKGWALPSCRASQLCGCAAGAVVAWHLCGCHGNDGGANLLMSPPSAANNNTIAVNMAELQSSLGEVGLRPGTGPWNLAAHPSSPLPLSWSPAAWLGSSLPSSPLEPASLPVLQPGFPSVEGAPLPTPTPLLSS